MHVLAEKEIPVMEPRMGRPPLGKNADDTKPTPVRFEAQMRARIMAALRPGESFAAFLRDAAERELKRRGK
ncbi:YlcI/YnfO family protein [Bacillus thuringiensis]|uniref:YlcI/YnfO family protein n=1 Tax=Bacillus thuringiensis TaxID=1428 RepID=UPI002175B82C|nr:YlcI/YnfO family protein [Bacillus thuringiensis]